jgi:uncharacterized repeat protein (TIGR01451 family)
MKKSTTRLATAAAVILMSAFAIVLAQFDARKRARSAEPTLGFYSGDTQESPLQMDPAWPGREQAGKVDQEQLVAVAWKDLPTATAWKEESPKSGLPTAPLTNSEVSDQPAEDAPWLNEESSVVTASGEQTALPAWLSNDDSLPSLPTAPPGQTQAEGSLPTPSSLPSMGPLPTASSSPTTSPLPNASPLPNTNQLPNSSLLPNSSSLPNAADQLTEAAELPQSPAVGSALPSNPTIPSWNLNDSRSANSNGFPQSGSTAPARPSNLSTAPRATPSAAPRTTLVSNQPGSRSLDGSQNPVMQILKRAPEEIQVGKQATFVITVRNAGSSTAHEVMVVDQVPRGSRFAESIPAVAPSDDGTLVWRLGEMGPGDERSISLQIVPEVEGEVGSVASVHFAAQASVRSVATLPQITLDVESNGAVIIGSAQQIAVNIQNTGSGVARAVRLEADIPEQLRHESGETQLEALIGDLRPGESRRLVLNVAAVQAGQAQSLFRAIDDDGIQAEKTSPVEVRSPELAATISGPSLRYLERQANYRVVVSNSGTAMARNLDFVVHLPVGLKFVSVDIPQATYNPQSHSVSLGLAELESGQSAPFTLTVLPIQPGAQAIRFNASGDLGIAAEAKTQVTVAGLAELAFTIGQDNGTVEIGASTTYAVQVTNVGDQADRNVALEVQLPEGSELLEVNSPVEYRAEGSRIVFAPLDEMRSRDVQTFRLQVRHNRAGNQVIRSQLTSENWPVAVVKEEGTLVYDDRN